MKTREEYIALITSHAEELKKNFDITSLRLFGSVASTIFIRKLIFSRKNQKKKPKNLQKREIFLKFAGR